MNGETTNSPISVVLDITQHRLGNFERGERGEQILSHCLNLPNNLYKFLSQYLSGLPAHEIHDLGVATMDA